MNYVVKTTEFAERPRAGRGNVGVLGIHKTNHVVKTTEFAERPRGGRGNVGVFGNHKMNYVVKTTELGRKPRAGRGNVGVFGNHKMNYVVKTTEFAERPRGRCGQQMESCAGGGTLSKKCAKNANWTGAAALSPRRRGYAAGAETGCFRDSQNELRCKNNGIGEETARRARRFNF